MRWFPMLDIFAALCKEVYQWTLQTKNGSKATFNKLGYYNVLLVTFKMCEDTTN